jgi:hypothetical protein
VNAAYFVSWRKHVEDMYCAEVARHHSAVVAEETQHQDRLRHFEAIGKEVALSKDHLQFISQVMYLRFTRPY